MLLYIGDTDAGDRMKIEFTYFYPFSGAENSVICLLAAVLFLLAVISFVKSKFDVLNPSFIYC